MKYLLPPQKKKTKAKYGHSGALLPSSPLSKVRTAERRPRYYNLVCGPEKTADICG